MFKTNVKSSYVYGLVFAILCGKLSSVADCNMLSS
jgi:hypothetical protein